MEKINQSEPQTNIECKLIREGGTRVEIGGIEYHFAPQPDGAHVAGVTIGAHVDRFLSITDAYRLYRGQATPSAAPSATLLAQLADEVGAAVVGFRQPDGDAVELAKDTPPAAPALSTSHPASFDIHGTTYQLESVVTMAQASNGLSTDDWAELSEDARADMIDEELDKIAAQEPAATAVSEPAPAPAPAAPAADADRETLSAAYKKKFNKPPHYRWSTDKIRDALAE